MNSPVIFSNGDGFTGLWIAAVACFALSGIVIIAEVLKKDQINRQLNQM